MSAAPDLLQSVSAYMRAREMLPPDGRILCACSGGVDSVALLHLLCEMPGLTVLCAHFDHGLRGEESRRDERFVRDLAASLGLPYRVGRGDVAAFAKAHGMGLEEAARALRYRFLFQTAAETGCSRIATAHTAGDNAETVLHHLIRGAGAAGLGGIAPKRPDGLIRPLLRCQRAELEAYLTARGYAHVEDSSNADLRYTRNALRRRVLPELERLNRAAVAHICAAAERLREDDEALEALSVAFLREHMRDQALPVASLLAQPRSIALRALRRLCGNPGAAHLERLLVFAGDPKARGGLDLPGLRVRKEGGYLRFGGAEALPAPIPRRTLRPGEVLFIPERGLLLRCEILAQYQEIHNSFNTFCFQRAKLCGKLTVGSRVAGDRIRLSGRGVTKDLRRLYQEAGLTQTERALRLVFSDDLGAAAAEGIGVAERCAPMPGEPALRVQWAPVTEERFDCEKKERLCQER